MRLSATLPLLLAFCAAATIAAQVDLSGSQRSSLVPRDDHEHTHVHSGIAKLELDDKDKQPAPPSYYTIDWEDAEHASDRHPGYVVMHVVWMSLAFFVALPVGIAMRSVNHSWHSVVMAAFYGFSFLGCATSAIYRKLTPNMYQGNVHGRLGYILLLLASGLTTVDLLNMFRRVYKFIRSGAKFEIRSFWFQVILGKDEEPARRSSSDPEYTNLMTTEPEDLQSAPPTPHKQVHYDSPSDEHGPTADWAEEVGRHRRAYSHSGASEATLYGRQNSEEIIATTVPKPLLQRIGAGVFATLERMLVFGALAGFISGIVIYTGACRSWYINSCLAHLIKGAIFWCYGLVSFARYLGTFSELGWAWNRTPIGSPPTAEFVESLVIFTYGITNTWMERFGAAPGSPFTTKQIQHIGIAVMFWFAGLLGMAIESKRVRRWLAASTVSALNLSASQKSAEAIAEPPSYIASFNPFPALVIGVTGAAMAAHHQNYVFQVQIHELWGYLLMGWSTLRCLTYFFLWIAPPRSILPSRPPTEALGSFFLACGGLVFMMSSEELTLTSMRRGRDDPMMFLAVAVATTCFALVWTTFVVGFKGYLRTRINPRVSYHGST